MTAELSPDFYAAEAKYESLRDDNVPAIMAVTSMTKAAGERKGSFNGRSS